MGIGFRSENPISISHAYLMGKVKLKFRYYKCPRNGWQATYESNALLEVLETSDDPVALKADHLYGDRGEIRTHTMH